MSEDILMGAIVTIIAVAFIGGCTAVMRSGETTDQLKACVEQKMEWRDGACVIPPPPGEREEVDNPSKP